MKTLTLLITLTVIMMLSVIHTAFPFTILLVNKSLTAIIWFIVVVFICFKIMINES